MMDDERCVSRVVARLLRLLAAGAQDVGEETRESERVWRFFGAAAAKRLKIRPVAP